MKLTPALEQSFWNGVDKSAGPEACWPWTRCKPNTRSGGFYVGTIYYAPHRVALELSGVSIPEGLHVLHSCDNPICCNPKHLSLGNHLLNMNQCEIRNRRKPAYGEQNGNRKLTENQVREIKKLSATKNIFPPELAIQFNVNRTTIERILLGKTWKSVKL